MVHKIRTLLANKDLNDWECFILNVTQDDIDENTKDSYYRVIIPKHIFDAVKNTQDKYITDFSDKKDVAGYITKKPFTNKIKSLSLHDLREQLSKLSMDALNTKELKETDGIKMICVRFKHFYKKEREDVHGGYMGKSNSSYFQWFIAFKKEVKKHMLIVDDKKTETSVTVYMTNKAYKSGSLSKWDTSDLPDNESFDWHPLHDQGKVHEFETQWHIIRWTEERELFFKAIEDKFNLINTELDSFLGNITEDNVEALMMNQNILQLKEKN
jgi:hypothetical protein